MIRQEIYSVVINVEVWSDAAAREIIKRLRVISQIGDVANDSSKCRFSRKVHHACVARTRMESWRSEEEIPRNLLGGASLCK